MCAAIACSATYSPEAYSAEAKLLTQQLFASYCRYFIEVARGQNLDKFDLLALLIGTENIEILESTCPGIFVETFSYKIMVSSF